MDLDGRFIYELSKIKQPEVFIGVARILQVKLVNEDGESRDFDEIFDDVLNAYSAADRKRRRELFKILKAANKNGD